MIINNFYPLFPIFFGLIFWNEKISIIQLLGLLLFIVAIVLFKGSKNLADSRPITFKWLITALLSLLFCGVSIVITKQYQLTYGNDYIKEYLIIYAVFAVIFSLPIATYNIIKHKSQENEELAKHLLDDIVVMEKKYKIGKYYFINTAIAAISHVGSDILFMMYITTAASVLFFPLRSIMTIVAITLASCLILKECISMSAVIGVIISVVSLVLLVS